MLGHLCLPWRVSSNEASLDAVQKLEGAVNELLRHQGTATCADDSKYGQVRQRLAQDVGKHVQTLLDLFKYLSGEKSGRLACQMHVVDAGELLKLLIAADLPVQLLSQLPHFEFETRKDIMNLCCILLWSGWPHQVDNHVTEYLRSHPQVYNVLVEGFANEEVALHFGEVLRSCARHRHLVNALLESGLVFELVKYARSPSLEIASDAFHSLRKFLLGHKDVSASWIANNSDKFFKAYNELLRSGEYVAQRQAENLLADVLLDMRFCRSMTIYVNDEHNLQIHMNLLKDASKVIMVQAFHVFKLFVANPQKSHKVHRILYNNRDKLIALLQTLCPTKSTKQAFAVDQLSVIGTLRDLQSPALAPCKCPSVDVCGSSSESWIESGTRGGACSEF